MRFTCPKHYLIRDLFLFSCETGIPYGDMRSLTKEAVSVAEDGEVWIKSENEAPSATVRQLKKATD